MLFHLHEVPAFKALLWPLELVLNGSLLPLAWGLAARAGVFFREVHHVEEQKSSQFVLIPCTLGLSLHPWNDQSLLKLQAMKLKDSRAFKS